MPRVTIKDIAERAGVSKTSVSFAFNNPSQLSEETLRRILSVAEELGYMPDPIARSMTTKRTGCIGLLVPQPIPDVARNPFFTEFLEGVGEGCQDAGLSLMLVPPLKGSIRRAVVAAAVDGFLTLGLEPFRSTMMVLQQRGVSTVMVDSEPQEGVPCVNVDDREGARQVMAHVLAHGHRCIGILGIRSGKRGRYEEYAGTLRWRIEGFQDALAEVGLSLRNRSVRLVECRCSFEGGYSGLKRLWKAKHKPTAVVTMSDVLAVGALEAARELGLRVPHDLSLTGYDDVPAARCVTPQLTTVHQQIREKGKLAVRLLVDLMAGNPVETHHVLSARLVERASVAPPSPIPPD